jgi:hypothetical protein
VEAREGAQIRLLDEVLGVGGRARDAARRAEERPHQGQRHGLELRAAVVFADSQAGAGSSVNLALSDFRRRGLVVLESRAFRLPRPDALQELA